MRTTATDSYAELLQRYQPRPIKTEAEADRIREVLDSLVDRVEVLSSDERDFMLLLATLIETWEEENVPMPDLPPHQLVKALLEARGLRQQDLVGQVFPSKGIASEVLNGKRKLTYDFVGRLADFFQLPADVFYGNTKQLSAAGLRELAGSLDVEDVSAELRSWDRHT